MNNDERAALVRHQYDAGLANGRDTANIIIKQFPDGIDVRLSVPLGKIADDALAHVVSALTTNGVDDRYIKPFKHGFYIGLYETYSKFADRLGDSALGTNKNG
jgi:hypothetical protein